MDLRGEWRVHGEGGVEGWRRTGGEFDGQQHTIVDRGLDRA